MDAPSVPGAQYSCCLTDAIIPAAISGAVQRAGLKPGISLDENCPVFMLKSCDACFQINPVRALKHIPVPTPQCRLSSSLSPPSCWPQHTTHAGPRDRPISKLTLQKQQVCVHVCRKRTELSQFPLCLAVVSGCAPVAAAGRTPF